MKESPQEGMQRLERQKEEWATENPHLQEWHPYFAWLPVYIGEQRVWLKALERRGTPSLIGPRWKYRFPADGGHLVDYFFEWLFSENKWTVIYETGESVEKDRRDLALRHADYRRMYSDLKLMIVIHERDRTIILQKY